MRTQTRRKVLKVAKITDANHGCKDEGNDDGVSCQSVSQLSEVSVMMSWMVVKVVVW